MKSKYYLRSRLFYLKNEYVTSINWSIFHSMPFWGKDKTKRVSSRSIERNEFDQEKRSISKISRSFWGLGKEFIKNSPDELFASFRKQLLSLSIFRWQLIVDEPCFLFIFFVSLGHNLISAQIFQRRPVITLFLDVFWLFTIRIVHHIVRKPLGL